MSHNHVDHIDLVIFASVFLGFPVRTGSDLQRSLFISVRSPSKWSTERGLRVVRWKEIVFFNLSGRICTVLSFTHVTLTGAFDEGNSLLYPSKAHCSRAKRKRRGLFIKT